MSNLGASLSNSSVKVLNDAKVSALRFDGNEAPADGPDELPVDRWPAHLTCCKTLRVTVAVTFWTEEEIKGLDTTRRQLHRASICVYHVLPKDYGRRLAEVA